MTNAARIRKEICAILGELGALFTRIAIPTSSSTNNAVEAKLSKLSGIVGSPIWVRAYQKEPKSIERPKLNV